MGAHGGRHQRGSWPDPTLAVWACTQLPVPGSELPLRQLEPQPDNKTGGVGVSKARGKAAAALRPQTRKGRFGPRRGVFPLKLLRFRARNPLRLCSCAPGSPGGRPLTSLHPACPSQDQGEKCPDWFGQDHGGAAGCSGCGGRDASFPGAGMTRGRDDTGTGGRPSLYGQRLPGARAQGARTVGEAWPVQGPHVLPPWALKASLRARATRRASPQPSAPGAPAVPSPAFRGTCSPWAQHSAFGPAFFS